MISAPNLQAFKFEPMKLDDRVWALMNEVQAQNRKILEQNKAIMSAICAVGYVVEDDKEPEVTP